jgi:membrane fusion protein (multidrug efflux system)
MDKLPQQRWRRWAGAGLLGLIVVTAGSVVFRKRSIEAYVTGDVVTITSPVEGVVTSQAVTAGQQFKAGETVLVIQANRGDAENLEISKQKLNQTRIELQATSAELKRYQEINQSRLKAEVASAERSLKDLQAQQRRYASQADRYRALVKNGAMDADTLVGAEAMASSLAQRVGNQRQQLSNLKLELKSAQATAPDRTAVFGGSARRMEIMEVELLRLISRRKELEVQEAQLKREVEQAQRRSRFVYQPRFPGLLLTERVSVGDEVNDGTTLLTAVNCDKLRVEALFEASKLKDVHLGQMVNIDWPNSQRSSRGRVVSLRGEQGVNGLETSGVAKFRPAHTDRTRAMISLQPNDLREQNCRLGERVRVDL